MAFESAIWVEANELAWDDCKDMPDNAETIKVQEEHCEKYRNALRYGAEIKVILYDEDDISRMVRTEGGIDIGDYTYYIVTDDRIDEHDLPRRN